MNSVVCGEDTVGEARSEVDVAFLEFCYQSVSEAAGHLPKYYDPFCKRYPFQFALPLP